MRNKKVLPLSKVYRLIEPGPVVLLTTAKGGRPNIMVMSWHTMMEFEPPTIGCIVSNRNFSFELLKATKECVINIPTVELAEKVVACGNCSGRRIKKLQAAGLTPVPASKVKAPMVGECYANLECKVVDTSMVSKYNFFVLEVLNAWVIPSKAKPRTIHHEGMGEFVVAGKRIKLPSRKK